MISVAEAALLIREKLPSWGETMVSLQELGTPTLTTSILSDRPYPPFHRVMMDGIAVKFSDYKLGLTKFENVGVIAAGDPSRSLAKAGTCFEIMTGAALPDGADLVIPYEHLKLENGKAEIVQVSERVQWENIHLKGTDCGTEDVVLESLVKMNGPHWGIAASMGATKLQVKKTPRIMLISTGDELVDVDVRPEENQIRRSNAYALKASLELYGWKDVLMDHLPDEPEVVAYHYKQHAPHVDLMLYSGGVSKGKFDYLPNVWADMGVTRHFHTVSQRPGKPLWFGVDEKLKTAVVGLPGNPVSSLVCLHRYLLPHREMYVRLSQEITFKKELTFFVPVKLRFEKDGSLWADPCSIKNSGEFTALAGSDGFIELPKDQNVFKQGEVFSYYSWGTM